MENGYKKTKEIKLQPEGTRNTGEGRHLQIKQLNVLVTTLNKKLEELRKRLKLNMFENILKFRQTNHTDQVPFPAGSGNKNSINVLIDSFDIITTAITPKFNLDRSVLWFP